VIFPSYRGLEKLTLWSRGKWAVCSGSIDPADKSPEAAARREILEETTLSDEDISLLRKGKPFSLTDEGLKTKWTIYPFAWQLEPSAKPIKFDWEHTEYRFVKPQELYQFEYVFLLFIQPLFLHGFKTRDSK
jgi:8-oxo-dGTP pyrophosphatase MutT (NUDIX family)